MKFLKKILGKKAGKAILGGPAGGLAGKALSKAKPTLGIAGAAAGGADRDTRMANAFYGKAGSRMARVLRKKK